jgi:uncharacterized damage-inducible protein DinB
MDVKELFLQFQRRNPIGVLLCRIIEHQVHHCAQVGTYLRILPENEPALIRFDLTWKKTAQKRAVIR